MSPAAHLAFGVLALFPAVASAQVPIRVAVEEGHPDHQSVVQLGRVLLDDSGRVAFLANGDGGAGYYYEFDGEVLPFATSATSATVNGTPGQSVGYEAVTTPAFHGGVFAAEGYLGSTPGILVHHVVGDTFDFSDEPGQPYYVNASGLVGGHDPATGEPFVFDGTTYTTIPVTGELFPGTDATMTFFGGKGLLDDGRTTFVVDAQDAFLEQYGGLVAWDQGAIEPLVVVGTQREGGDALEVPDVFAVGPGGAVVFAADTEGTDERAAYIARPGAPPRLVHVNDTGGGEGEAAPGVPGLLAEMSGGAVGPSADAAFLGFLRNPGEPALAGIGVWTLDVLDAPVLVMASGEPAPGLTDAFFAFDGFGFGTVTVYPAGTRMYVASDLVDGAGSSRGAAMFAYDYSSATLQLVHDFAEPVAGEVLTPVVTSDPREANAGVRTNGSGHLALLAHDDAGDARIVVYGQVGAGTDAADLSAEIVSAVLGVDGAAEVVVEIENHGPEPVLDLTLTITPDGDARPIGQLDPACTNIVEDAALVAIECVEDLALVEIPAGEVRTFAVQYDPVDTFDLTATVSSESSDPDPTNNSDTATLAASDDEADLSVRIRYTDEERNPATGKVEARFDIVVTNRGPDPAQRVVVELDLAIEHLNGGLVDEATAFAHLMEGDCPAGICSVEQIGPAEDEHWEVFVLPEEDAVITLTATVSSGTSDPNPDNNTDTDVERFTRCGCAHAGAPAHLLGLVGLAVLAIRRRREA